MSECEIMKEKTMETLFQIAQELSKNGEDLAKELFKCNPSFEDRDKKSLATLAGKAKELKCGYEFLAKDLIKKHERG